MNRGIVWALKNLGTMKDAGLMRMFVKHIAYTVVWLLIVFVSLGGFIWALMNEYEFWIPLALGSFMSAIPALTFWSSANLGLFSGEVSELADIERGVESLKEGILTFLTAKIYPDDIFHENNITIHPVDGFATIRCTIVGPTGRMQTIAALVAYVGISSVHDHRGRVYFGIRGECRFGHSLPHYTNPVIYRRFYQPHIEMLLDYFLTSDRLDDVRMNTALHEL